jgi:hypothetical protein
VSGCAPEAASAQNVLHGRIRIADAPSQRPLERRVIFVWAFGSATGRWEAYSSNGRIVRIQ